MNSNLKTGNILKELLLKKLSYAIICSVIAQITVVIVLVFIVNVNIQPALWFKSSLNIFTSFNTWLHLIPFSSVIFAQIILCAKEYILKPTCKFTRFRKFVSILSLRIFILGFLHILVGGVSVWLYLSLSEEKHRDFTIECEKDRYCLAESTFLLTLSGLWIGCYYFIRIYGIQRNLVFLVIYQPKLLQFKASLLPLLKQSKSLAFFPVIYYIISYYLFGSYLYRTTAATFGLRTQDEGVDFLLYSYVWFYTILYIFNMKLMKFFFELFLTEPIEHSVMAVYDFDSNSSEALMINNIPILQHLACMDLYLLSIWSPQRRQALFTLSQPGGHPHTWNGLIQNTIKLISEFTDTLNKSTNAILIKEEKPKVPENTIASAYTQSFEPVVLQRHKYHNMRNMTMTSSTQQMELISTSEDLDNFSQVPPPKDPERFFELFNIMRNIRVIKYIFGELPDARIQHCLKNGQIIVWVVEGLANIIVASFTEDPYGIVQKDLPVLITSLVELKQSVEKLNKVTIFSRRGPNFDEFSFKMKNSIQAAVKRSLCNICRRFGLYLNGIPLRKEIITQLKCYL